MLDTEILETYVDLEKSCPLESERKEIMEMLYKYKDTFSLRDEIGICPKLEEEIDITDKSPFLLGNFMLKRKIKLF